MAAVLQKRGLRIVSGRTECHMFLVDLHAEEPHRQGRRGGARARAHHGQQERDPQRSAEADGDERRAHRLAGDDHARLQEERGRARSPDLIADVLDKPADDANLERVAGEVKALCARFPVYK